MNFEGLVKRIIPGIGDEEMDYVLWNKTAFPFTNDRVYLTGQLKRYKLQRSLKVHSCDLCGNFVHPETWVCEFCRSVLKGQAERVG